MSFAALARPLSLRDFHTALHSQSTDAARKHLQASQVHMSTAPTHNYLPKSAA
jgi:hypothetical protein